MTQPGRNPVKLWHRTLTLILKYKVKFENLWLRKLNNHRPRTLRTQSISSVSVDSANTPPTVHISRYITRRCKPASLTKVMAVMAALDEIEDIEELITVEAKDILPGSGNNLNAGDRISWKDAFHNMLMASSNTSANTVIRNLGLRLSKPEPLLHPHADTQDPIYKGIEAMNAKARALGMINTHFTNASGLDSFGMYTTAKDMMVMGVAALDYKDLMEAWGKTTHIIRVTGASAREIAITSTLKQLFDEAPGVCGGKTGTLPDGTQNLLICRKRGDSRIITALMQKGGDRHTEILKILSD